jgi:predicted nucleic acid-binding protein
MKVVCNASPLIALGGAGLLDILPAVFSRAVVPRAVIEEIKAGAEDDAARRLLPSLAWLEAVDLDPPLTVLAGLQLGRGEAEVIEWASRNRDFTALLDDRGARRTARRMGISVCGTLGALALAVSTGVLPSFDSAVDAVRAAGLFVDEATVQAVRGQLDAET